MALFALDNAAGLDFSREIFWAVVWYVVLPWVGLLLVAIVAMKVIGWIAGPRSPSSRG